MNPLNDFERILQVEFALNDRDSRRMDRAIHDIAASIGMTKTEVFEFLMFGCEGELSDLVKNYDWIAFQRSIRFRLQKQS